MKFILIFIKHNYIQCLFTFIGTMLLCNAILYLYFRLLKGRANDGFPIDFEDFIRNSIRSFPFRESNLFKHIVKTVASVEKVGFFRYFLIPYGVIEFLI